MILKPTSLKKNSVSAGAHLPKSPTGIRGLDEITGGGLPTGRSTLVCGSAGAGKTMLAIEFLVHGATQFGEPGVFMMFEENAAELTANVRSLGHDLGKLAAKKQIIIDHVQIERSEIEETGEYDLDGLFIRLGHAVDSIGAKRVVLDTVEALFAGLPNHAILRAELRRLFRWLKGRGLTAMITGERGEQSLTRYGLEEYVADCVIVLDQRIQEQISTRRLRVLKYRGSAHGTNEYPFQIGERGISVLPITSLQLDHQASDQRVHTGIVRLDEMLGGKGVFRGSSVLVSGSSGTGKSSIAATFAETACRRGERVLLFAFEESSAQIVRNMSSIGINLAQWVKKGQLSIQSSRPTMHGQEEHLLMMQDAVDDFRPGLVIVDPITNLSLDQTETLVKATLMRLIDFLKIRQITALFTSLTSDGGPTSVDIQPGVASLMDTWLLLRNIESDSERNRIIYILKSRGMAHSNQVREFVLNDNGIALVDVYIGASNVLIGTARIAQEQREIAAAELHRLDQQLKLRQVARNRKVIEAQIAALQTTADSEAAEVKFDITRKKLQKNAMHHDTHIITLQRAGNKTGNRQKKEKR